jgi:glutamyl-tRNA reductase
MFDEKMEKTIAIHDSVMPKMSNINDMISKLEQKKDSLSESKKVQAAKEDLKQAHDQMMNWMKNLSNTFTAEQINQGIQTREADSLKKALKDLDELKKEAENMQKAINSSIKQAEDLLSENH